MDADTLPEGEPPPRVRDPNDRASPYYGMSVVQADKLDHERGWCGCDDEWRCWVSPEAQAWRERQLGLDKTTKARIAADRAAGRLWLGGNRYVPYDYGPPHGRFRDRTLGPEFTLPNDPRTGVVVNEPEPTRPDPEGEPEHLLDAEGWPLAIPYADTSGDPDADAEEPDLLGVLYSGKINALSAHPGLGKTWWMLAALAELVDRGRRVLWIDGEDSPRVFTRRLHVLGYGEVAASPLVRWIAGEDWRLGGPEAQRAAASWAAGGHAFIDAASSTGAGESGDSFAAWRYSFLDPFTAAEAGATFADHLAKRYDPDRLPSPLGSITKVAAVTGASIELQGRAWTRHKPGTLAVVVRKDRPGGLGAVGETVARIVGTPAEEGAGLTLEVLPPAEPAAHTPKIVDQVWAMLERDGERNTSQIIDGLGLRADDVRAALRHLTDRGEVAMRNGPRGARLYSIIEAGSRLLLDDIEAGA